MIQYTPANIRTWSRLGSCGAFGIAATEFPNIDSSVVILTSDLCFYSGLERFKAVFPDRLYNLGIAEQNMIGVAAGFAKEGFNPFATTYATFASMRCADQVRVNMGYMQLGIKLIGLTAGLSVGILGATHISIEDMAVMRSIPNITILSPADCTETIKALLAAIDIKGPVYIRLSGTMNNPIVYHEDYNFEVGKAIKIREGKDITIIATGSMVFYSLQAAEFLKAEGIDANVVNMHTIKPFDNMAIEEACNSKLIITVEEHSIIGGLGGVVAECLSGKLAHPPHLMIGISDEYKHAAEYNYLLEQYGLTPGIIANKIANKYKEVQK